MDDVFEILGVAGALKELSPQFGGPCGVIRGGLMTDANSAQRRVNIEVVDRLSDLVRCRSICLERRVSARDLVNALANALNLCRSVTASRDKGRGTHLFDGARRDSVIAAILDWLDAHTGAP